MFLTIFLLSYQAAKAAHRERSLRGQGASANSTATAAAAGRVVVDIPDPAGGHTRPDSIATRPVDDASPVAKTRARAPVL